MSTRAAATVAALAVGAAVLVGVSPASAAVSTTIGFVTTSPVTASFSDDWFITLYVESSYEGNSTVRLKPTDGTVDVYLSGIGGAYAAALPIQADGLVYFSQPAREPLLGAGTYDVTAIYNPPSGGYYGSSQTASSLTLTIEALTVEPSVVVGNDPAVSERPLITASIAGTYSETTGGAPAGTWHFTATSSDGTTVFDSEVAQAEGGTEPVRVEITGALTKGQTYTVASEFSPAAEIASGLTVSEVAPTSYAVPAGGLGDVLGAPVAIPLWLTILMLVALLAVIATAIILGVRLRGRASKPTPLYEPDGLPQPSRIPGDPGEVQIMSLQEMGLPEPETVPDIFAEATPTLRLPESTTWLLSDVEPATHIPTASEAPTERLDTISASELERSAEEDKDASNPSDAAPPTERIETESNTSDDDQESPRE